MLSQLSPSVCMATEAVDTVSTTSGLIDAIDTEITASESSHGYKGSERSKVVVVGDLVGGHKTARPARQVPDKEGFVSYCLKTVPDKPTTLEIEEMYGRDDTVRGYLVYVDGVKVYLRTWRGCGAGPVHYFITLPPVHKERITVNLVNQLDAPFSISRLWVFSDFNQYFRTSHMAVPFRLAPTVSLSHNYDQDKEKLLSIKNSLGERPYVSAAWTVFLGYSNLDDQELERQLDYILRLAQDTDMPVQIELDSWWAQTTSSSDGHGGYWTDVPYQQVVFNASQRHFQLSIPNRWGDTPWLTVNHPDLNAFKAKRLHDPAIVLRSRYRALLASGKQQLMMAINLDNEPVYWATGNAGLGADLLEADFNSETVKDAQADGIDLDPSSGLGTIQRFWLYRNLLHYNKMIAGNITSALAQDANLVTHGEVHFADDFLRNNVYTQAMINIPDLQYPLWDPVYPLWETAAPVECRTGGEWNGDSVVETEAVTRQLTLGRNAAVNAECGKNATRTRAVKPAILWHSDTSRSTITRLIN